MKFDEETPLPKILRVRIPNNKIQALRGLHIANSLTYALWPSSCFLKIPSWFPPQGFCTCCSCAWTATSLDLARLVLSCCSDFSSSVHPSRLSSLKPSNCSLSSYLPSSLIYSNCSHYLSWQFIICFPPTTK